MSVDDCKLVDLSKITDQRGNLTFVEKGLGLSFDIRRVYYLYDIPSGASRGGHGHKKLSQLMIATSGSFDVLLNDGHKQRTVQLNRPFHGLYICPMIWRELGNFSSGSVCLVLASDIYDESDYYRDYEQFRKAVEASA